MYQTLNAYVPAFKYFFVVYVCVRVYLYAFDYPTIREKEDRFTHQQQSDELLKTPRNV